MQTFEELIKYLEQLNDSQTKVKLQNFGLDSKQAIRVVNVLAEKENLTELDVRWNNIDDEAAQALGELTQLRNLDISHNKFTQKGITKIIKLNTRLEALEASYNNLTLQQARELLQLPKLLVNIKMDNFTQADFSSQSFTSHNTVSKGRFGDLTQEQQRELNQAMFELTNCIHANLTPAVRAIADIVTPPTDISTLPKP